MDDTTPAVETANPQAPSNGTSTVSAPSQDNSNVSVEAAKKEAEQARMRANQLENELAKIKADQAAARQKQLEENEQWKTLAEERQAELDMVKADQSQKEETARLQAETKTLLDEYPLAVRELAETAGLSLPEDSDEAKAKLKAKLDTFAQKVSASAKVEPNNPAPTPDAQPDREKAVRTLQLNNIPSKARREAEKTAIGSLETLKVMRAQAGIPEAQ